MTFATRATRPVSNFGLLAALLFLVVVLSCGTVLAQSSKGQAVETSPFVTDTDQALTDIGENLKEVSDRVADKPTDDGDLAALQSMTDQVNAALSKVQGDIDVKLEEVRAKLTELGTAPGPGEAAEPEVTTQERNQFLAERSGINALSDKTKKLADEADALSGQITEIRREQFTEALFRHTTLTELFSSDFSALLGAELKDFSESYGSWLQFVWNSKRVEFLAANILSIIVAFVLYRISSGMVARADIDFEEEEPDYVIRLLAAFMRTLLPSIVLFAFLLVSYLLFTSMSIMLPDVQRFVRELYIAIAIVVFVFLLTRNILSPYRPKWRLIPVGNSAARNLTLAVTAMAVINWSDQVIAVLSDTLEADIRLDLVRNLVSSVLIGCLLVAISFIRARHSVDISEMTRRQRFGQVVVPSLIAFSARIVGLFVIIIAILGYIGLARFVAMQIMLTGSVLISMYIGIQVGRAVAQPGSLLRTARGRLFVKKIGLSPVRADQLSLVFGLVTYVGTLAIGIPLILLSWGVRWDQLRLWAMTNLTSVKLGSITISLGGILIGVLLFIGGFLLTRWFEKWFDDNVLLRSRADSGVRNSVKTGINYLGVVIAVLIAVSAAGVNLSSLALVASALSIGIGFGLQTIVSNFVSGLILLVERPFKVGDWIVTGSAEGFVKRISVRATEIETFQRQSIIVPNSELINASVGNWMHHNQMGRSEVAVGVSYDSDPRRVMEILMDIAVKHPLVLQNPEPMVIFSGFGESTLDFELRVYLADVFNGISVRNDIRVAMFERFRDEGITIPYPQRDLHIIPQKERHDELANAIRKQARKPQPDAKPEEPASTPSYDHPDAGNDDDGGR